jgi:hypothetical protein
MNPVTMRKRLSEQRTQNNVLSSLLRQSRYTVMQRDLTIRNLTKLLTELGIQIPE